MVNRCHDRLTGRFISAAKRRAQAVQGLDDLPDDEWVLDEAAMRILEGGIAMAIEDGWLPPAEVELEPQP